MACVFGGVVRDARSSQESPGPFMLHPLGLENVESKEKPDEPCGVNLQAPFGMCTQEANQLLESAQVQVNTVLRRLEAAKTRKAHILERLESERKGLVAIKLAQVSQRMEEASRILREKRPSNNRLVTLWRTEEKLGDIALQMRHAFVKALMKSEQFFLDEEAHLHPRKVREHKVALLQVRKEWDTYQKEYCELTRAAESASSHIPQGVLTLHTETRMTTVHGSIPSPRTPVG